MPSWHSILEDLRRRGSIHDVIRREYLLKLHEALVEIGKLLGGRDHSTIMHGIAKIEKGLESDSNLRAKVNVIREQLYGG